MEYRTLDELRGLVRMKMRDLNITQDNLAFYAGLSSSTVSRFFPGKRVRPEQVREICKTVGIVTGFAPVEHWPILNVDPIETTRRGLHSRWDDSIARILRVSARARAEDDVPDRLPLQRKIAR